MRCDGRAIAAETSYKVPPSLPVPWVGDWNCIREAPQREAPVPEPPAETKVREMDLRATEPPAMSPSNRLVHNAYQLNIKGESTRKTRGPFTQTDYHDS